MRLVLAIGVQVKIEISVGDIGEPKAGIPVPMKPAAGSVVQVQVCVPGLVPPLTQLAVDFEAAVSDR